MMTASLIAPITPAFSRA